MGFPSLGKDDCRQIRQKSAHDEHSQRESQIPVASLSPLVLGWLARTKTMGLVGLLAVVKLFFFFLSPFYRIDWKGNISFYLG